MPAVAVKRLTAIMQDAKIAESCWAMMITAILSE